MWTADDTQRLRVGPTTVDFIPLASAVEAIASRSLRGGVHLVNAYTLALAEERPDLAIALEADVANFPDGTPLMWWARRRGHGGAERVYGPDLMEAVLDASQTLGTSHYLYGSTPDVLEALKASIGRRWPDARIVGTESPPFRPLTESEVVASVVRAERSGADVVWVGMGTPKQDLLVHQMAGTGRAAYVAVGAAFDFIAGTKSQAPRWMMKLGLEWLYRLATEPKRLWKRYLVYNVKFVHLLWRSRTAEQQATIGTE